MPAPETIISVIEELVQHLDPSPDADKTYHRACSVLRIIEAERDASDQQTKDADHEL